LRAIQRGFRLSNAYIAKNYGDGGMWNGVSYQKEIVAGEFEHLALVEDPRYEESVIMTPEEFKTYNEANKVELIKLANSKKEKNMGLKFWKRAKIENSIDLDDTMVELPKSKKEMSLSKLVNDHDAFLNMNGYANGDHMVKVGENEMSVNDLVKAHMATCNEMEEMKKKNSEKETEGEELENSDDETVVEKEVDRKEKGVANEGEEDDMENSEEEAKKVEEEKKKNAKEKAARLKNANRSAKEEVAKVHLSMEGIALGKKRYGSGN
jgi:hypothetical protein